ncbi:N-acyl homoserine lactonase family protein [Bosea sp. (in: a-proteobacteria)]|uniref:N-acyl homoserine lactonase family protein n=1 Tax=Bosea sp. (in: a-proteobacteria) TaxID=1871050 RepID=UPI0026020409|nr:N-acyl homoserine lactonase family protein [Bosea sp. (in: a-proteobacteria)]MCO5090210.1 N-acyl homoserine lactonase family protein [Bosea sp. (in: a-proteobacteria)]
MAGTVYELHALRYATNQGRKRFSNFLLHPGEDPHQGPMPLDFFVWVAVGGNRVFLIDSGSNAEVCTGRGHQFLICPSEALKRIGIAPEDVTDVILTHMHWDHAGNLEKFPNARFHVQPSEIAYATGPCMLHSHIRWPYDVEQMCAYLRMLFRGRVAFHDGDDELAPGLSVHHVGGHAKGLQIVRVQTRRGQVVVASDAIHFFENVSSATPFPIFVDLGEYLSGWTKVAALAESGEHIIPGHDPMVMKRYRAPSPELQGLAVKLSEAPVASDTDP